MFVGGGGRESFLEAEEGVRPGTIESGASGRISGVESVDPDEEDFFLGV